MSDESTSTRNVRISRDAYDQLSRFIIEAKFIRSRQWWITTAVAFAITEFSAFMKFASARNKQENNNAKHRA